MPANHIRLRISTPTGPVRPGRGFYQLDEDVLYVQIGEYSSRRQFFSYLEGDSVRLEFDRHGTLMFIEVDTPRRQWAVDEALSMPLAVEPADIRWLEFRAAIENPEILASGDRTTVRLTFSDEPAGRHYYLAEDVVVSVDAEDRVVHVWVAGIVDDLAGQEIGAFRKMQRGNGPFFRQQD